MENPDLPDDILLEIFSRTPTKCVGKCRTLSKYWKEKLSKPRFIEKHLFTRKQTIQQDNLALISYSDVYIIADELSQKLTDPRLCIGDFPWLKVLGSCNGLVLLHWSQGLMLMNPITGKLLTIQPYFPRQFTYSPVLGLGHDSRSDDYKIVQLSGDKSMICVHVYSVKNRVWKRLDDGCYPYNGFVPRNFVSEGWVFVNGALHWLVYSVEGYPSCIAAFNLSDEAFSEIPLSKELVMQLNDGVACTWKWNGVSVVGGCLLILDNFRERTDVWIMREYGVAESWVKFRIPPEDGDYMYWDKIVAMLCYVEEGVLQCLTGAGFLVACDLNAGTVRRVVLGGCNNAWFSSGVAFVDSLVSPEGPW